MSAPTAQPVQPALLARRVHPAAHQALQVPLEQLGPLVLVQAVQQALQACLASQEHLVQRALKEQRALPAPQAVTVLLAPQGLPDLTGPLAPLAFKVQLELAQLEFKDQPERPACPVQLELQGQAQLVLRASQEPG